MFSFSEAINLGNLAKNMGEMSVANLAFGLSLRAYFVDLGQRREVPSLLIETQDSSVVEEVYYDLLAIEEEEGESLCIPVPLLQPFAAFCAAKSARVVGRQEHGRKVRKDVSSVEIEELWRQLFELGDEDDFAYVLGEIIQI